MGVSTNAYLAYGIPFEEGFDFPWNEEPWDGDIDDWWLDALGYKPPSDSPYDEHGNRLPDATSEQVDAYWAHKREFRKANPLPVEEYNYCSADYPMTLLAIPGTRLNASRGYPTAMGPEDLKVCPGGLVKFHMFLREHGIEAQLQEDGAKPQWWLFSYYG